MRGWEKDPEAPETTYVLMVCLRLYDLRDLLSCSRFAILGGGNIAPIGTFSEYVAVERDQVVKSPEHLDDEHVAAWPLGAVTAWRYPSIYFSCFG